MLGAKLVSSCSDGVAPRIPNGEDVVDLGQLFSIDTHGQNVERASTAMRLMHE